MLKIEMGSQKLSKYGIQEECELLTPSANAKHAKSHSPRANLSHGIAHAENIVSVKCK